ncbi:hypothetical protein GW17_00057341, partial [Ensete ventricosum]
VSGSADKTLCVWQREEGDGSVEGPGHTKLAVLAGHEGPIKCLRWRKKTTRRRGLRRLSPLRGVQRQPR